MLNAFESLLTQIPLLRELITLFLSQIFLSLPFLVAGILLSSALLVFVDEHKLVARFPRSRVLASIVGSALGLLLPIGQLGAIPLVRRLLLQGASLPLAVSFLIAAPTLNFWVMRDSFALLAGQPRLAFLRLALSWLMAIALALLSSLYRGRKVLEQKDAEDLSVSPLARMPLLHSGSFIELNEGSDPLHRSGNLLYHYAAPQIHARPLSEKFRLFFINAMEESLELGFILVLTTVIAVTCQVYWPFSDLSNLMVSPLEQTLTMLVSGIIWGGGSLSSTGFIVPFLGHWWQGALLAFLLTAGLFNLSGVGLMLVTLRFKPLLYFGILGLQFIFLVSMILNYYF